MLVTAGERMDIYSKVCRRLDFFHVAVVVLFFVVFFFHFLVCAVSMDSAKVGKCRIACCSCLSRGERNQNTHKVTVCTLWAPTFTGMFFSPLHFVVFLFQVVVSDRGGRTLVFALKARRRRRIGSAPSSVCFTIAPVRVSEPLQCRAEVMMKNNKTKGIEILGRRGAVGGCFSGAELRWYGKKVHPQCWFQSRFHLLPFIQAQRQNVKMGNAGPTHTHTRTHKHTYTHMRAHTHRRETCTETRNSFNIVRI